MNSLGQESIKIVDNKVQIQQLLFYVVEANSTFRFEQLIGYDALIVDAQDENYTRFFVKKIRSHRNPEFYLKPLFLLSPKEVKDPFVKKLNDGIIFSTDQMEELAKTVKDIFLKTTQLNPVVPPSFEAQTMKKVFDYMYTRNVASLVPFLNVNSSLGYTWPEVSVHFESHEETKTLQVLEWAAKEQLFTPEFVDRVYLCGNCSNGFMLYREVCPSCNSANVTMQDNIHHFPCAYVGPSKDFVVNEHNALECPKCNKSLRHIGVDYDKPSSVCHCNNCDKNFQDLYVKAKCLSCHSDTEVQYLITQNIFAYNLSSKNTLMDAINILTSQEREITGTVRPEIFKVMLHYQAERIKNNPSLKSFFTTIELENVKQLHAVIGENSYNKLLNEIISIVREYITSSDFISIDTNNIIRICVNDIDEKQLNKHNAEIAEKTKMMVKNNISGFELEIKISYKQVTGEMKNEE